jgi:hypothetical protein
MKKLFEFQEPELHREWCLLHLKGPCDLLLLDQLSDGVTEIMVVASETISLRNNLL